MSVLGIREINCSVNVYNFAAPADKITFLTSLTSAMVAAGYTPVGPTPAACSIFGKTVPWTQDVIGTPLVSEFYSAVEANYIAGLGITSNVEFHVVSWK